MATEVERDKPKKLSRWMEDLEETLHERPRSGPEPSAQEAYYDWGFRHLNVETNEPWAPWTDESVDHEAEL